MDGQSLEKKTNEEILEIVDDDLPKLITFKLPKDSNIMSASDPHFRHAHMEHEDTNLIQESGREYKRELLDYFIKVRPLENGFAGPLLMKIFLYVSLFY